MASQANLDGVYGQEQLASGNSPFNILSFLITQALGRVNCATLVEVVAVHGGGVGPVGTVDVRPMVGMVDGAGQLQAHAVVYGLPYIRIQGGKNAVITDPQVGDIGFCVFADRDISRVKAGGTAAAPGSARRFDYADGLFLGGWGAFAGTPERYIMINDDGVKIVSDTKVEIEAPDVKVTANTAEVLAPLITLTGAVTIEGTLNIV